MNFLEEPGGQISFLRIDKDLTKYVAMGNSMIMSRQGLTSHEIKLVRLVMKQIVANDLEFKPYEVSPSEFARILNHNDASSLYHEAKQLCNSLMHKQLEITSDNGSWVKYNWMSMCRYNAETKKMELKLNSDLKPFLLGLVEKGYYTQYAYENIAQMSSLYGIRLFEMLLANIKTKLLPKKGIYITLTKQQIVDGCMIYKYDQDGEIILDSKTKKPIEHYKNISQFKLRVIAKACEEINNNTMYYVPYESEDGNPEHKVHDIKEGKSIVAFKFYVNMSYH